MNNSQYLQQLAAIANLIYQHGIELTEFHISNGYFYWSFREISLDGYENQPESVVEMLHDVLSESDAEVKFEVLYEYPCSTILSRYRLSGPIKSLAAIEGVIQSRIEADGPEAADHEVYDYTYFERQIEQLRSLKFHGMQMTDEELNETKRKVVKLNTAMKTAASDVERNTLRQEIEKYKTVVIAEEIRRDGIKQ